MVLLARLSGAWRHGILGVRQWLSIRPFFAFALVHGGFLLIGVEKVYAIRAPVGSGGSPTYFDWPTNIYSRSMADPGGRCFSNGTNRPPPVLVAACMGERVDRPTNHGGRELNLSGRANTLGELAQRERQLVTGAVLQRASAV